MSKLNVLIVGASIAGPTAAYWFAKAGASVTVIERSPTMRTGGQNIDIRTAGVTIMRKMPGMETAVRAKLSPLEGFSFVREDGRPYGILRATGNPDQQSVISEYEIFRGDLALILYDLTKDNENIKYIFGEQVASIQQSQNGVDGPVTVEFANGLPTSEYDLVVACDGATSKTRAIGLGCSKRDYVEPLNCWVAYFSIKQDLLDGGRKELIYNAVAGLGVGLGPDSPGVNRATLASMHPRTDCDIMRPFREAMRQGDDALKNHVRQRFKGVGWKAGEILGAMAESDDLYASEMVQVKLPSLYKGRFVMVGDAGYAPGPTGGGTSLAIAGGYILAGEVGKHKGDLAAGLKSYENRMRPIIDDMQKIPPLFPGIMAPQTACGIWLRNHIFAFVTWSRIVEFVQKYFAGAFASTERYTIPDYEWAA